MVGKQNQLGDHGDDDVCVFSLFLGENDPMSSPSSLLKQVLSGIPFLAQSLNLYTWIMPILPSATEVW